MGEPIKIVLTAETEQAVAALRDFLNNTNAGLKQVSIGAKATSEGVAGMSYYFRSGMDSIRLALAGGGPRAAFYALDEAIRGLAASGTVSLTKITTLLAGLSPAAYGIVGGFTAAAAAGVFLWHEFSAAQEEAVRSHNELVQALQQMPVVIGHINEAAKAGFLSPETSQKLLQNIGAVKATLSEDWLKNMTPMPASTFPVTNAIAGPGDFPSLFGLPAKKALEDTNRELVEAGFLLKEIGKDGHATFTPSDKGQALLKIIDLRQKLTVESLSGYDKERAAAKQSYDDQLAALNEYLQRANSALKAGEGEKLKGDLLTAYNHQVAGINLKQQEEDQKKAQAAFAEGQRMFAQTIAEENKNLDAELNASAARQGKTREEIYQEEFAKKIFLLTQQLYSGEIDERQYTAAVQEASTKRLQGTNAEAAAKEKLRLETEKVTQAEARQKSELVLSDPHASQTDKLKAVADQVTAAKAALDENTAQQKLAQTDEQRLQLLREHLTLENDYTNALRRQEEEENRINQARLAGVKTMFQNMATAAKAFGNEGLAVYRGFAIAQATIDTAQAAIAAYKSVVGIPYVGPILAPIAAAAAIAAGAAQISQIESASAREMGGPVAAGMAYVVGEKRPELFVPETDGYILPSVPRSFGGGSSAGAGGSAAQSGPTHISVLFLDDPQRVEKEVRDNPRIHHVILDVGKRNAHIIQPRA